MIDKELVRKLVEEKIEGTGNYIVDIRVNPGNKVIIEIDSDKGLFIRDCVEVSRHVEHSLDREKEDFELQVSSPGLNQPLKIFKQYVKNIGKKVEVTTKEGEKITGKIISVDQEAGIRLSTEIKVKDQKTKKRKTIEQIKQLKFDEIKETKVTISFKK